MNDRGYISNYLLMLIVDTNHTKWEKGAQIESWRAQVGFRAKISQPRYQKTYQKTILGDENLILVNNVDGYPSLKMAGKAKEDTKDEELTEPIEREVLCIMECNIVREEMEELPLRPFQERYKKVAAAMVTPVHSSTVTNYPGVIRSPETDRPNYTPGATRGYNNNTGKWEDIKSTTEKGGKGTETKKRISDMTQKEWESYERNNPRDPYKFEHRNARAFLNASIEEGGDITMFRADYGDAIEPLRTWAKAARPAEEEWYINNFIYEMRDWVAEWFPGADTSEYLEFLDIVAGYLTPYSTGMAIVRRILDELKEEITMTKEELIKEATMTVPDRKDSSKGLLSDFDYAASDY